MSTTGQRFVGLISGTSVDGVDAVVLEVTQAGYQLLASCGLPYPESLRADLIRLAQPGNNEIDLMGQCDQRVAHAFAAAAEQVIQRAGLSTADITAIGSHGQTIRHRPTGDYPFTLQIGDPNTLAELTGVTVVADFRRRDMAAGGQGAPLAPAFHRAAFSSASATRAVVNIGGIANVSLLTGTEHVVGYDCGPGNTLMDAWIRQHRRQPFDADGAWASEGHCHAPLLDALLDDPFFKQAPPKSTGPEYFNTAWLRERFDGLAALSPADVQQTLLQLTVESIAQAVGSSNVDNVFICGGGVHNPHLMAALTDRLAPVPVESTEVLGIHPDWVEAAAFAWLAAQTLDGQPGNAASVTGAKGDRVLGGVYYGN